MARSLQPPPPTNGTAIKKNIFCSFPKDHRTLYMTIRLKSLAMDIAVQGRSLLVYYLWEGPIKKKSFYCLQALRVPRFFYSRKGQQIVTLSWRTGY